MTVTKIEHVEDCIDSSIIREFLTDNPIDYLFIQYIGKIGELKYYPAFARPFFMLSRNGDFTIKGVEGDFAIRIRLFPPQIFDKEKMLLQYIQGWHNNDS